MSPTATPQISMQLRTFSAEDPGGWSSLLDQALAMDAAGIDRLVVSEHVAFGENMDAYADPKVGGSAGGKQPTGPDGHWLDPLVVLTTIGALTERIRLGTGILIAALRRPVVLAKTAATIDVLSGGRLDLGVGVGWQREEYEAAGLEFDGRGRLLDQTLEVCQTLWREPRASYESEDLTFEGIHQMPKPLQEGGVPIWVSGTPNKAVARRLSRFGSGWIPWGAAMADPVTGIAEMRELVEAAGGDPSGLQVMGYANVVRRGDGSVDLDATMESVPALVAAGVTDVRLTVALPEGRDAATDYLSGAVERFRTVVA
ncbi:TIGR03619 family F420-dependent LLM class oxidoreductase [Rhabdothermincola salaria]|uniref:TIGR03619 family F420-dependent LLM class oxidoreductase n=1 Tax=Rhabdothermincola salaria TaxID=2903142 RepID=UPI001E3E5B15|nr:TIGR03619 family F420-dependent LLM class oxidoreductase [Rhabdothermincola salaria]MCD9624015.1 TIGR03619 family F420-dependent LLM class oxidoreductase [Rhabdothermincola salaria]